MTPTEGMRLLGLSEAASLEEIKRAYRRLAQELHPDKRGGDDATRRRFVEIIRAYRMLAGAARSVERGGRVGACWECGDFGEVLASPDGHVRCQRCVFRPLGGRLLPFPPMVIVKCSATIVLLGLGIYLLLASLSTGSQLYAVGAFVAGVLGLAALALTCVSVVYCLQPDERLWQRKPEPRSRRRQNPEHKRGVQ